MNDLSDPIFHDEAKARRHLEVIRWPDGPYCPHCGERKKITRLKGKSHQPGLCFCRSCQKKFSVMVGTLFERSHIPLHKWLMGFRLMASSKKGISAHQLHRSLDVTYKTAWFMAHRIREAMKDPNPQPMGGGGSVIEADETYFGKKPGLTKHKHKPGPVGMRAVFSLVERGGKARSFHIKHANAVTVRGILVQNARRDSELNTDESGIYKAVGEEFRSHHTVVHSADQYVHPQTGAHSNSVEGFFSIFKRGMKGVYQHCGEQHLQRYLAEFDFRYNERAALGVTDDERALKALKGIEGKRLTYRRTGGEA